MRSRGLHGRHQQGLGLWGWIVVLGLIAFFATVGIKTVPVYLNHRQMLKALNGVADQSNGESVPQMRSSLQRRWDIDYISHVEPKDIKVIRTKSGGRAFAYDYYVEEHLFYNVYITLYFKGEVMIDNGDS